jgi:hypothetical protein
MFAPIPTWYNGMRMRSRLEARWALFFDCLRYSYRYEPNLRHNVAYLPDFMLDTFGVAVEVKFGARLPMLDDDLLEWEQFLSRLAQLEADHERWQAFVDTTGRDLWVCVGPPVVWDEGQPSRPAWALVYRNGQRRHLAVWTESGLTAPAPLGTVTAWQIGPSMLDAACAIRDHAFHDEAA